MKTIGTGGIAGGPVDVGRLDLPMEPRVTDLDAFRAGIEAKRMGRRSQVSPLLLAGRTDPTATAPPPPAPEPVDDDEEPLVWDRDEDDDPDGPEVDDDGSPQQVDNAEPALAVGEGDDQPPRRPGRPARVLTPEEVDRIVTQYRAGKGMTALAGEVHIGVDRVRDVLRDAGVELRPGGRAGQVLAAHARGEKPRLGGRSKAPALGADVVARMAAAYLRGDTLRVIAAREHLARVRVRDALADAGVKIREKGWRPTAAAPAPALDVAGDVAEQEPPVQDVPADSPGEQVSVEDAVLAGAPPLLAAEAVATVALDREDGTQVIGDPVDVEDAADTSDLDFAMTDWGWFPIPTPTTTLLLSGPLDVGDGGRDYPRRGRHRADVDHHTPPGDFLLALAAFIRDVEHLLEQGRRLQASLEPAPTKEPTR